MNQEILEEKPVSMVEVKAHLEKIQKRDEELNFRANKTLENLNALIELKPKDAEELKKKLTDLDIPRLKEVHICKLVDLLPTTEEQMKVVLQGYTITVSKDNLKKLVEAVKSVA